MYKYVKPLTFVASSLALVCSAIKLTHTQDLCIVEEQRLWSKVGVWPRLVSRGDPFAIGDLTGDAVGSGESRVGLSSWKCCLSSSSSGSGTSREVPCSLQPPKNGAPSAK